VRLFSFLGTNKNSAKALLVLQWESSAFSGQLAGLGYRFAAWPSAINGTG
jgi:hypothetical protein